MSDTYFAGQLDSAPSVGGGQSLTILPGASVTAATISGGTESLYGSAQSSVIQASGIEYVFTGGLSYRATLTNARQVLGPGTPPITQLTVQGGNAPVQGFYFSDIAGRSLAQAIANSINTQPAASVQTFDTGNQSEFPAGSYLLINDPSGGETISGAAASQQVIANGSGLAFFAPAGGSLTLAAAGGNNTIGLGSGSTNNDIVTGDGNDVIFVDGSGSVNADAGTNTLLLGSSSDVITSDGTGDLIAAGSGDVTIGEGGTASNIFLGSGTALVADSGAGDTVVGGTGAETMYGGENGTYYLGTAGNLFVGGTAPTSTDTVVASSSYETVFGGSSDVVFGNNSALQLVGGNNGNDTITSSNGEVTAFAGYGGNLVYNGTTGDAFLIGAAAGSSTINASGATAGTTFEANAGSATFIGGAGNDLFTSGTGNAQFTGGAGDNQYYFQNGVSGGTDLITDFKAGDTLILGGYGSSEVANALASATENDGIETVTLPDNTKIELLGDPTLNTGNVTGFAVPFPGSGQSGGANVIVTNYVPALAPLAPGVAAPAAALPPVATANGTAIGTSIGTGGEQDVGNGAVAQDSTIEQGGSEIVSAGGITDNTTISGGALSLASGATASTAIIFDAAGGALSLGGSVFDSAPISGFTLSDSITLSDIAYDPNGSAALNAGATELLVTENNTVYDIAFDGATGEHFALSETTSGDTIITEDTLCYLRGTQILTLQGEKPIEQLAIGDAVVTRFGGVQRIKWIGRQGYDARFLRRNRSRIPVRIKPGALGQNMPVRPLFVSPGHSMLCDGVLLLASALVNGIAISQSLADAPAVIEYFQIELDHHDCILAEGTWSETYADAPGMRAQFHNAGEFARLYPQAVPPDQLVPLCAPRPLHGPALEAALRPFLARAIAKIQPGPLDGYIEVLSPTLITGWAMDIFVPDLPVLLTLRDGDTVLGATLACTYRADLEAAGKGNGNHGFAFALAEPLDAAAVRRVTITNAAGQSLQFLGENAATKIAAF